MGLGDLWSRTLVYFGIAEDDEWDEDGYVTEEELAARTPSGRTSGGSRRGGARSSSTTGPTRVKRSRRHRSARACERSTSHR